MAVLEQGGKPSDQGSGPLAIICGGGSLPLAVADAVAGRGRRVVLFPVRGWADPAAVAHYPHHWIGLAQIVRLQRLARREGCRELVFIGAVLRPSPRQLRPDLGTLRLLPRIVRLFLGGDDHLLTGLGRLFEEAGFRLLGAHEVAPEKITVVDSGSASMDWGCAASAYSPWPSRRWSSGEAGASDGRGRSWAACCA